MRTTAVLLLVLATALTGCTDAGDPAAKPPSAPPPDAGPIGTNAGDDPTPEPVDIQRSIDLMAEDLDLTLEWSVEPGMAGTVLVELEGNPQSIAGSGAICYTLEWSNGNREGGDTNCDGPSALPPYDPDPPAALVTIINANASPDDYTLTIWSHSTPDPAVLHITIESHAA